MRRGEVGTEWKRGIWGCLTQGSDLWLFLRWGAYLKEGSRAQGWGLAVILLELCFQGVPWLPLWLSELCEICFLSLHQNKLFVQMACLSVLEGNANSPSELLHNIHKTERRAQSWVSLGNVHWWDSEDDRMWRAGRCRHVDPFLLQGRLLLFAFIIKDIWTLLRMRTA